MEPTRPLAGVLLPDTPGVQVSRLPPPGATAALVRHVWVSRWDVAAPVTQPILEYPGGNIVVEPDAAALYCVSTEMTTRVLAGRGWAFGVLLRPGAAAVLCGRSMSGTAGTELPIPLGAELIASIRAVMPAGVAEATTALERWLGRWEPDAEGFLTDRIVTTAETAPDIGRVRDLAAAVGISERTLQRVCDERLGVSPKWLLRRRRLQEAATLLRTTDRRIADIAAELGYTDHAHLTREFRAATGETPTGYRRRAVAAERDVTGRNPAADAPGPAPATTSTRASSANRWGP